MYSDMLDHLFADLMHQADVTDAAAELHDHCAATLPDPGMKFAG